MRKRGLNQKQILLVVTAVQRKSTLTELRRILSGDISSVEFWMTMYRREPSHNGVKVIGRIANLTVILPANRLDEIAITLGLSEYYRLEEIVAMCEKSGGTHEVYSGLQ